MIRAEFARRLGDAAVRALAFAREHVIDDVPEEFRFDIRIVPHHPAHEGPPVDPLLNELWIRAQRGKARELTLAEAADELCLGDRVPEWIDISLDSIDFPREDRWRAVSFIELRCSRTLVDDTELWYANEGIPPFHFLGPAIPHDWLAHHTNAAGNYDPKGRRFFLARRKKR